MGIMKELNFVGDSLKLLRDFPGQIKQDIGFKLYQVQNGLEPVGSKQMATVGSGVRQISAQDESGWYRIIYYAKTDDVVYVLHCFNKKTNQTSQQDISLAKKRYKDLRI